MSERGQSKRLNCMNKRTGRMRVSQVFLYLLNKEQRGGVKPIKTRSRNKLLQSQMINDDSTLQQFLLQQEKQNNITEYTAGKSSIDQHCAGLCCFFQQGR